MHTYIRLRSNPAAIGVPLNGVRTNQPARGSGCEQSRSDPIRRSWPRTSVLVYTSAVSKDMLVERFQAFASEVLVHPVHELIGRQRPIRLDDGPFAVQPARLDRGEPGAFHRQAAPQDPDPAGALHPAVMRPNPRPHRSTDVPSGVVPHQHPHALAILS